MNANLKQADEKQAVAFPDMAFDILVNVLRSVDKPGEIGIYFTKQLSELTGARTVILFQCLRGFGEADHGIVYVNPDRLRPLAESAEVARLAMILHQSRCPIVWRQETGGEAGKILTALGCGLSIGVPLHVGTSQVGLLLLLDLPDPHDISQVIEILDLLSSVLSLVFLKALFERQERTVEEHINGMKDIPACELKDSEQPARELKDGEKLFPPLIGVTPIGIFRTGIEGRCLHVNEQLCRITGFTLKELYRDCWFQRVHPDDRDRVIKEWYQTFKENKPFRSEFRFQHPDGTATWMFGQAVAEREDGGEITVYVRTLTQATDCKRTQEVLRESEIKYRSLFENANDAIFIMQEDLFIDCNPSACKMFGCTKEQLWGQTPCRFSPAIQPDGRDSAEKAREKISLALQGEPQHFDWRHIRCDGTPFDVEISLNRMELAGQVFLQALLRDITEREWAREALRKSDQEKKAILDNLLEVVIYHDTDMRVLWVNRAASESVGRSAEELLGRHCFTIWQRLNGPCANCPIVKSRKTGRPQEGEITIFDGRVWFVRGCPVRDGNGKITGIVESAMDITERKRSDEILRKAHDELEAKVMERTRKLTKANLRLQELDRLKSMFIASMSHELRTPLNSIIGFTSIILMGMTGDITEEQRKQLTIVKNSADHLLSLINDVIDVSKIEAGQVKLYLEEFDLPALVREVKDSFAVALAGKNLQMPLNIPESLPVRSDKRRIKQVLVNLVDNAVKFTDSGEIEINLTKQNEAVVASVRDTGTGIENKDMNRLFKAFSQIHTQGGRLTQEGTGLGLYISKKIIDLLGGRIKVESEPGKGTRVTITLPSK